MIPDHLPVNLVVFSQWRPHEGTENRKERAEEEERREGLEKEWEEEDRKEVGRQEARRETEAEGEDAEHGRAGGKKSLYASPALFCLRMDFSRSHWARLLLGI